MFHEPDRAERKGVGKRYLLEPFAIGALFSRPLSIRVYTGPGLWNLKFVKQIKLH
jgi:hypothetical protein